MQIIGIVVVLLIVGVALYFFTREEEEEPPVPPVPPVPPEPPPVGIANLYGTITDSLTGEPIVRADITVYQDISATETKTYRAFTDEWGFYQILGMVAGVPASIVIYAGGYKTYTRENKAIGEGNIEFDIKLSWAGGPRDVPRFIRYSLPSQIEGGSEFNAGMTVWLPYQSYLFRCSLEIHSRPGIDIKWALLPANLYDKCNEYTQAKYTRFDTERQYNLEQVVAATYTTYRDRETLPLPPGIYEVSYDIHRQKVEVTEHGGIRLFSSDAPGDYRVKGIVGTVEII